jgi:antitoxin (DNA-binding transcriptional repressor) of toxin-antitoxin stability system
MKVTASQLRSDIYRLLDQVLESGEPIEIERKGRRLRITAVEQRPRLDRLVRRDDFMRDGPESYIHLDWSQEWRP